MMMKEKRRFLIDQAVATSIMAAFQHAGVYGLRLKDNNPRKKNLRKDLAGRLRSLGEKYHESVTDELTDNYKQILRRKRFRIGIAQKAVNVYLKNLWCLSEITTPPHCPLDRQIIDKLGLTASERSKYDWTKLDDIDRYKELIQRCHVVAREAEYQNIAEWELDVHMPRRDLQ